MSDNTPVHSIVSVICDAMLRLSDDDKRLVLKLVGESLKLVETPAVQQQKQLLDQLRALQVIGTRQPLTPPARTGQPPIGTWPVDPSAIY